VLAALAFALLRERAPWLLAAEALLVVSAATGFWLLRALFGPLELVRASAGMLAERDFSTRLRDVGQPELDALIGVYNRMIDALREERLRALEQHHFLEEVVRASPAGVLTFDFDGRLTTANPGAERLLRRPAADLAGRPLGDLPAPFIERIVALEVGHSLILPLYGNRRVRWQKSHFMDRGSPRLLLLVEELTEELRRSERAAYEKIVRVLSHEINNSIGASASLLDSCLRYAEQIVPADRGDFETALTVAVGRMRHLNTFVRSYAEVVRLPPPRREPVDLARLVEDVGRLLETECVAAGVAWSLECVQPPAPVSLDAHQIEQVLVNVLRNALEAAGPAGWVRVRLDGQGRHPVLTVEDSGPGIPSEVQTQLFTPFFSTKENGRGIGLMLAQEILTQHGFGFTLESRPGQPTRFTIRF
jgi:nitrogen fixation/metabolism regulation signal transduction histidine kinase